MAAYVQEICEINVKCTSKDVCPFYSYINVMMKTFKQPVTYSPIDYDRISGRRVDGLIKNIYDWENYFYGGHKCSFGDIKASKMDSEVFERCRRASILDDKEDIYVLSYMNWFRSFFNLHILPLSANKRKPIKPVMLEQYQQLDNKSLNLYFNEVDIFHVFQENLIIQNPNYEEFMFEQEKSYDFIGEDSIFYKRIKTQNMIENEYYDYLKSQYTEQQIFEMYKIFLMKNPLEIPLWANTYRDPSSFSFHMDRQYPQYVDVIRAIDTPGRLYIVGDGPGTGSLAAWTVGREYISMEPNGIGDIAKAIGLIRGDINLVDKNDDILLLFNVVQYFTEEERIDYYEFRSILIIDEAMTEEMFDIKQRREDLYERRRKSNFVPHKQGAGKVFF